MAFSSSSLHPIAIVPGRKIFHYQTADAIEEVLSAEYFSGARHALGIGDFVICEAAGPIASVMYVTSLLPGVTLARLPSESSEAIGALQARIEVLEAAVLGGTPGDDEEEDP